jgi:hypothetical protein
VMVTSVPWQARSSARLAQRDQTAPGVVRWGMNTDRAGNSPSRGTQTGTSPEVAAVSPPLHRGDHP